MSNTWNARCIELQNTGERYQSTPLFADIPADMTEEEKELSEFTPSMPPPPPDLPGVAPEAVDFVKKQIAESKEVVVWSLEYCEFCWTLTSFLDRLQVPYTKIGIGSFEYAKDQMGNKYHAALSDMAECVSFPQLFIDGEFKGSDVDACMMWKKGEFQSILEEAGLENDNFGK